MDRSNNRDSAENRMLHLLFDSGDEDTSWERGESSLTGNNMLQQDQTNRMTGNNTGRIDFGAWLPHNLYKSSSSSTTNSGNTNNNNASGSSSTSRAGPLNPRREVGASGEGPVAFPSSRGPRISENSGTNVSSRSNREHNNNELDYPPPLTRNIRREQIDRNDSSGSLARPGSGRASSSFPLPPHEMMTRQDRQRNESDSVDRRSSFVRSPFGLLSSSDVPGGSINGRDVLSTVEMHQILDAVRMDFQLQAEDCMLIDPFVDGFTELHDPHRDMRLDIDNMSYEELLALEERIGNVSSGLSKGKIGDSMKKRTYEAVKASRYLEPCCICQGDYETGDNIGKLDCGHEFHSGCIAQWLALKNICPICRTTGIGTRKTKAV